jgi:uncharacterized membrane protein YdbT with pleckstrin-like domain
MSIPTPPQPVSGHAVHAIERPDPKLLTYYTLAALPLILFPPVGLLVWGVNFFRYRTMRYRFDGEGISMRWGILFRKEIILNYARIQDIHLVSNFVERHLGLARIQIQTASGSSTPEMTIEGVLEFERVRDYLYERMRGTGETAKTASSPPTAPASVDNSGPQDELAGILREIASEMRNIREAVQRGRGS